MLETVNVDAARLQLLNDRINQTLEAINQVRQTANQGIQHSMGVPGVGIPGVGVPGVGIPGVGVPGVGFQGSYGNPFVGQQPFGTQFGAQHPLAALAALSYMQGGLGHTAGMGGVGLEGIYGQHPIAAQLASQHPLLALALLRQYMQGGIGHSGVGIESMIGQQPFGNSPFMGQQPVGHSPFMGQQPWVGQNPLAGACGIGGYRGW